MPHRFSRLFAAFFLILAFLGTSLTGQAAPPSQDYSDWQLVAVDDLGYTVGSLLAETYPDVYGGGEERETTSGRTMPPLARLASISTMSLAPDGETVVAFMRIRNRETRESRYETCVHTLGTSEIPCYEQPADSVPDEMLFVSWSPDSRYLVTTLNTVQNVVDSDLWLFDVTTGTWRNLTDDGYAGSLFAEEAPDDLPVDMVPVWDPAPEGPPSVYFLRVQENDSDEVGLGTGLYRMSLEAEEPTLVADLTSEWAGFGPSNANHMAISPDGTQMLIIAPVTVQGSRSDIWRVDLATGAYEIIANSALLSAPLPAWVTDTIESGPYPGEICWSGDGTHILLNGFATGRGLIMPPDLTYSIDASTLDIRTLVDLSEYEDEAAFVGDPAHQEFPLALFLTPDGQTLLYGHRSFADPATYEDTLVSAVPITFDAPPTVIANLTAMRSAGDAFQGARLDHFCRRIPANGRVLSGGYLLTFSAE